jgi:hypothetical protein
MSKRVRSKKLVTSMLASKQFKGGDRGLLTGNPQCLGGVDLRQFQAIAE